MFLWRTGENYPIIITKYSSLTSSGVSLRSILCGKQFVHLTLDQKVPSFNPSGTKLSALDCMACHCIEPFIKIPSSSWYDLNNVERHITPHHQQHCYPRVLDKRSSQGPVVQSIVSLTLLLLNTTCPVLANSIDPDQLASEEANWSGSALFVIKYLNFYQKPRSNNLIGWKLEVGVAS